MKYLLIIFLILILPFQNYAQDKTQRMMNKGDILIKFSPTGIIYILEQDIPDIEFGASYFLNKNQSIQFKYGKKFDIYNFNDEFRFAGFKVTLEYKYFIKQRMYISLENGFIKNNFTDYYNLSDWVINETEEYISHEKIKCLNQKMILYVDPKFGITPFISKNFILDFYIGFGILYTKEEKEENKFSINGLIVDDYEANSKNEYFGPKVSLGMNICYRINIKN